MEGDGILSLPEGTGEPRGGRGVGSLGLEKVGEGEGKGPRGLESLEGQDNPAAGAQWEGLEGTGC